MTGASQPSHFNLSSWEIISTLWGVELTLEEETLAQLDCATTDEVFERYVQIRWIRAAGVDLCSISARGRFSDDEVYCSPTLRRLIPRTYLVPWDSERAEFDHAQAITGLTKIAGMQDEGVHQVINVAEVNTRCAGGEVVSTEKSNGKACVFWARRLKERWVLGWGSKRLIDGRFCYDLSRPLSGEVPWGEWVREHQQHLEDLRDDQTTDKLSPRSPVVALVACYTLKRLAQMEDHHIGALIKRLCGGVTLCGELEEGGKHIVPTRERTVYFAASLLTPSGVELESPVQTLEWLDEIGFQREGELTLRRDPFVPLRAQPSSLELSSGLREGEVRYFLSPDQRVVAAMKIKDPHYMFYRKLRNAMIAIGEGEPAQVIRRLARSLRDSYYQRSLRDAGIPERFSEFMLRAAARFLVWFASEPDLGARLALAGFSDDQVGLGALLARWRSHEGYERFGEYAHIAAHPELYEINASWLNVPKESVRGDRVAMVALRGAQGSGKSSISQSLSHLFNERSVWSNGVRPPLALPAEQDPLQRKRDYQAWLSEHIWPALRLWLERAGVLAEVDELPSSLTERFAWDQVSRGKPGTRFINLLNAQLEVYREMLVLTEGLNQEESRDQGGEEINEEINKRASALTPPLIIINARCNQHHQAVQRWEAWLDDRASSGLVSARLNIPVEVARERILKRNRDGDQRLSGQPLEQTHQQVLRLRDVDIELDATLDPASLTLAGLEAIEVALSRVIERAQIL